MIAIWLMSVLTYLCFVDGEPACTTPDGKRGDCRSILECPPLRSAASKPRMTLGEVEFLKRSSCGFEGNIPKVCCATATDTCTTPEGSQGRCQSIFECGHILKMLQSPVVTAEYKAYVNSIRKYRYPIPVNKGSQVCCATATDTCTTPEGSQGRCQSIFECGHILKMLQSPVVTAEYKAYVNSIRCESNDGFNVCCGPPPVPLPPQTGPCQPSAAPPDPRTNCCGLDGNSGNKIVGGNATSVDDYPWLAIIEKKQRNQTKILCGGVLISGRYVLTAAHCVVGTTNVGTPAYVRLGEYDVTNAGRDCVTIFDGGEDCNEDPVVIAIQLVIPHPDYIPSSPLRRNDIAMLRLEELAPYTDFIRPICLPTRDVTANIPSTVRLFAAGWGPNNETHSKSDVKLHVGLPYKSIESCQPAYDVPRRRVPLWRGQLCAGGERGRDTCKGDSGGPLMYPGPVFEVVGIVSFGATPCGLEDIPGVYTKVYEYLPWIRSNIQP